jgi:signal transduction histidine kinase
MMFTRDSLGDICPANHRPTGRFGLAGIVLSADSPGYLGRLDSWPVNMTHRLAAWVETATLALALGSVLAADTALTARHGDWIPELTVGVIVCSLAVLRDRGRVGAATAGLAVCGAAGVAADVFHFASQPGFAATLGLLVLGAAAIRVAPVRVAVAIAAVGVVVLAAGRLAVRHEYIVPLVFAGLLAWGGALTIGVWLRLGDGRRRLAIDAARRDERLELARELHDVVAHHVAGIVVQAQAARLTASETLDPTLAGIESAGNDALAAMRRVVGLLRDPDDAGGLSPGQEGLSDLVARFAERNGAAVRLLLPDRSSWPPEVTATVYRVVQEALTNVVKHAPQATNVLVAVGDGPYGADIEIANDGPAIGPVGAGFGLVGMRERAEALGGTLRAGPGPDGGWVVRATVPLSARSPR